MGAGALYTYLNGDEYAGSYPLWDWQLVPGTTVARDGNVACVETNHHATPTNDSCWVNCPTTYASGETAFVGVASTGRFATAAFNFVTPKMWLSRLKYKKSWHFIDGRIVAMVTGIGKANGGRRSGTDGGHPPLPAVTTSIEQRWLGEGVLVGVSGQKAAVELGPNTSRTFPTTAAGAVEWIHHDQSAYIMLPLPTAKAQGNATVTVSTTVGSGDWSDVGAEEGEVSGGMFTAFIEHDAAAVETGVAAAAYMVVPSAGAVRRESGAPFDPALYTRNVAVVDSTDSCHAVAATVTTTSSKTTTPALRVFSIVFFAPGSTTAPEPWGLVVEAMQACTIVIVEESSAPTSATQRTAAAATPTTVMTISDPTQALGTMAVKTSLSPNIVHATLPKGEFAGKSVTVQLSPAGSAV